MKSSHAHNSNSKQMNMRMKQNVFILSIIVLTIIGYSNTFYADYHFDDHRVILNDGFIKNFENVLTIQTWKTINLRPLSLFTFALNYRFHGISIFGYHLTNLFIHLATTVAFFLLLNTMLKQLKLQWPMYLKIVPVAILALHPIQTQAVTYIVQRMTSLSVLFYLLGMLMYLKARISVEEKHKTWFLRAISFGIGCILMATGSVLSKQIGISIALAISFLELFILGNAKHKWNLILGFTYLSIIVAGLSYIFYWDLLPYPARYISRFDYFISQLYALPLYFKIIFTGIGQNIDHYIPIQKKISLYSIIGGGMYIGMLFLLFTRIHKLVKFSFCFFTASMLIESSILPIRDVLVEHRMYLPMVPISIIIGYAISKINVIEFQKQATIAVAILILTALTFTRNSNWDTNERLWASSVQENNENPRALNNLGQALMDEGKYCEAIPFIHQALLIKNNYLYALVNLSLCYAYTMEPKKSLFYAKKSYELYPNSSLTWYALGVHYQEISENNHAKNAFASSIKHDYRNYFARKKRLELIDNYNDSILHKKELATLMQLNPDFFVIESKRYLQ